MDSLNKYCQYCGSELDRRSIENVTRPYCNKCRKVIYLDPKVAAVTLVHSMGRILLVRRAIQPHYGKWSLPSGYVDRGEAVEKAAVREVWEETNLKIEINSLQGIYSGKGPVILAVYQASPTSGQPSVGSEVSEVGWFNLDSLPELPFPHDDRIISDFRTNLKI